jgi:hypothetical protein
MSVKQMLGYWAEEGILHRDEELIILKGVHGPNDYNYFVRMEEADIELEVVYKTMYREILTTEAEKMFEENLVELMKKMQPGLTNQEPAPSQWRNRKKARGVP